MANVHSIRPAASVAQVRLGPATVVEGGAAELLVARGDGPPVRAQLALSLPYEAAVGDVVLVVGQGDEHWVVGVISGRGKTTLALQGDVTVRAVDGTLALEGDRGVVVRAPAMEVHADAVRTFARTAMATLESFVQRVTGLLAVHAGQSHTIVEEEAVTQSKTAAIQTEGAITINGKEILLG